MNQSVPPPQIVIMLGKGTQDHCRGPKSECIVPQPLILGIAEFAGLEFARLENDGVEQEETYILHTMK